MDNRLPQRQVTLKVGYWYKCCSNCNELLEADTSDGIVGMECACKNLRPDDEKMSAADVTNSMARQEEEMCLEEDNAILLEALRFYADENSHNYQDVLSHEGILLHIVPMVFDRGAVARAAIAKVTRS